MTRLAAAQPGAWLAYSSKGKIPRGSCGVVPLEYTAENRGYGDYRRSYRDLMGAPPQKLTIRLNVAFGDLMGLRAGDDLTIEGDTQVIVIYQVVDLQFRYESSGDVVVKIGSPFFDIRQVAPGPRAEMQLQAMAEQAKVDFEQRRSSRVVPGIGQASGMSLGEAMILMEYASAAAQAKPRKRIPTRKKTPKPAEPFVEVETEVKPVEADEVAARAAALDFDEE